MFSEEKVQAYEALEKAIEGINKAFGNFQDSEMTTGWLLVVSGLGMLDESDPEDDEMEMRGIYTYHTRRGQDPTLTRGIAENFLDEYREL